MIRDEGAALFPTTVYAHRKKWHVETWDVVYIIETNDFTSNTELDGSNSHDWDFAIVRKSHITSCVSNFFVTNKIVTVVPKVMRGTRI